MMPLVAALGRSVGIVSADLGAGGGVRRGAIELARMLAREAAITLDNARLYDEIRPRRSATG